jgi:hypothetical protein
MTVFVEPLCDTVVVRRSRRMIIGGVSVLLAGGSSVGAALAVPGSDPHASHLWLAGMAGTLSALSAWCVGALEAPSSQKNAPMLTA